MYIAITFISVILVACNKKGQFDSFPNEKKLNSQVPKTTSKGVTLTEIKIIDSLLIAYDHKPATHCMHIYNLKDFSYITSAGLIGKGPKEITNPLTIAVNKSKKIIWVLDEGKFKLFGYKIPNILSNNNVLPSYEVSISEKIKLLSFSFNCYTDSLFALGQGSEGAVKIMNFNGNIIDTLGNLPVERKENEPKVGFGYKMRRKICIHNDTIVISFNHYDRIMAINTKGNTLFSIKGPDNIKPNGIYKDVTINGRSTGLWQGLNNTIIGYRDIYVYKKHIFSLYSGKKKVIRQNNRPRLQYFTKIHVFDLHGNPHLKYKLDREINEFVIDKKNNRFIGIGVDTEEGPFAVFHFNTEIFKNNKTDL